MARKYALSIIAARLVEPLGCMGVLCLMVGTCAFGSGAILQGWTGIEFHRIDAVITIVGGPVIFLSILLLQDDLYGRRAERRMRRIARRQRRFKPWAELVPLLESGAGTLIVEVTLFPGMSKRVWWTPDNAAAAAPGSVYHGEGCISYGESDYVDWFYELYLNEKTGSAILTDPNLPFDTLFRLLPDELLAPFRELFPKMSFVALPLREAAPKIPNGRDGPKGQTSRLEIG